MRINIRNAIWLGIIAGVVMVIILAILRAANILNFNLSMVLGTMFGLAPSAGAWILGFIVHLIISAAIALLYAWGFEMLHTDNWLLGLGFGIIQVIVAGLLFGVIPQVSGTTTAPGMFLANFGAIGIIGFIVLHLIYGVIVGSFYKSQTVETTNRHPLSHFRPAHTHK